MKLTEQQKQEIRELYATGNYSQQQLADMFGVSRDPIVRCGLSKPAKNQQERFWAKVDVRSVDECWEWRASKNMDGYGHFDKTSAHRVSYLMANGEIPPGHCVRHKCDNPSCVNPNHLITGTQADNNRDRAERGRTTRSGPKRKLNDDQILEAKAMIDSGQHVSDVAKRFNVSGSVLLRYIKATG